MATFKPVVLKGKIHINKKGESNIKILIVQNGQNEYIKTDYYTNPEWMLPSGKVNKKKHPNADYINMELGSLVTKYERTILQLGEYARVITAKQIKELLTGEKLEDIDFFEYADRRIQYLKDDGQKTWKTYHDSIEQIKKFVGRPVLQFAEINEDFSVIQLKKNIVEN
jgi:hypothetical protein